MDADQPNRIALNGINGNTGDYAFAPLDNANLARVIQGLPPPDNQGDLRDRAEASLEDHYGIVAGSDPCDLKQAGWGIIFPDNISPDIEKALTPLINKRKKDAGSLFKTFEGTERYNTQAQESKDDFLIRHNIPSEGPADPVVMPYYLLLVGSPEQIPYEFQHQLDVQYAVGRIDFETPQEYENYANSVVEAEER